MNKIHFTYKDFDSLEDYRDAIGKFWSDGPLTLERTEEVMEHLGIYQELKGETKEDRKKRYDAFVKKLHEK